MDRKDQGLTNDFAAEESFELSSEFREKGPNCPTGEELAALIDHKCSPAKRAEMQAHIKECELCKRHCMTIASFKMSAMRTPASSSQSSNAARWGCILFMSAITILTIIAIWILLKKMKGEI